MVAIREWRQRQGARLLWLVCSLVFAIPSGAVAVGGVLSSASAAAALWYAAFAPLAVLTLRTAWRIPHARVVISDQAITVAGPVDTHVVPLAAADRFEARNVGGNQPSIVLVRDDGRRPVSLWIFNRNGFVWQFKRLLEDLQTTVDELNRTLSTAKQGPPQLQ